MLPPEPNAMVQDTTLTAPLKVTVKLGFATLNISSSSVTFGSGEMLTSFTSEYWMASEAPL